MPVRSVRMPLGVLVCVAALLWVLVGCGSSPSTTIKSTTTSSAGCADVMALKSSLLALKNVNIQQGGVDALTSALADVKTKLDAATSSASSDLQPSVKEVQTAVASLETATNGLTTSNLTQKTPAIAAALTRVATAISALSTTIAQRCPGS
ncbi:hypothetical protein [Terrabacter sp. 2YAF2]|uniref:hypothetical protein n=1 Tax=Terrabacter sp. 2YAF2 TaxID=3233026 RepID=UPI003F95DE4E